MGKNSFLARQSSCLPALAQVPCDHLLGMSSFNGTITRSRSDADDRVMDPSFSQTYARAPLTRPAAKSPLALLLLRIAAKIEERCHNPWWMLQRSFFYKCDKREGIRSVEDLTRALEYFHVLLQLNDAYLLFDSFQAPSATPDAPLFDFKRFARELYPADSEQFAVVDGRKVDRPPQPTHEQLAQHRAEQEQYEREQARLQAEQIEYRPIVDPAHAPFTESHYVGAASAGHSNRCGRNWSATCDRLDNESSAPSDEVRCARD